MNTIKTSAAQGDVLFVRVNEVPSSATRCKREKLVVVAHSETSHHHAIDGFGVDRFDIGDPLVCYLSLSEPFADVVHHRPWDTHGTVRLEGGTKESPAIWQVRRQREYTPQGWRRVED